MEQPLTVIHAHAPIRGEGRIRVTTHEALRILRPYVGARLSEQAWSVLPVIGYLILFQIAVLRWPLAGAAAISASMALVVLGLAFFMEGLRLWLAPVGQSIGDGLPRKAGLGLILILAFVLGAGASLAEPALGALRAAAAAVDPGEAPLLHRLLSGQPLLMLIAIGAGVGLAVMAGTLRLLAGWRLKPMLIAALLLLLAATAWAQTRPDLRSVIGLAWDTGAVIVGPVTVPLVLAIGAGMGSAQGRAETGLSGFGTVALISLLPIALVLLLAAALATSTGTASFRAPAVETGRPVTSYARALMSSGVVQGLASAARAVLPLSIFLFVVHLLVLRERIAAADEVALGLGFALLGIALFNAGLIEGLAPLGDQIGRVAPGAYSQIRAGATAIPYGPLYERWGRPLILFLGFTLGYGTTIAEPGLHALANQVEQATVGAFRRRMLLHAVAFGVGLGMTLGVARIIYALPLVWLLIPVYLIVLALTLLSTEEFTGIAWDAGAATTGPFTVPLVVAMGLGLAEGVPSLVEGFGILSLASAGPIATVLGAGLTLRAGDRRAA